MTETNSDMVNRWFMVGVFFIWMDIVTSIIVWSLGGSDLNPLYTHSSFFINAVVITVTHFLVICILVLLSWLTFKQYSVYVYTTASIVFLLIDLWNVVIIFSMLFG